MLKRTVYTQFSEADMKAFEPEMKVGILATVDEGELPHLTLIASLRAGSPGQVIWGQFTEGMSKANVLRNPKTGFLIMTLDRQLWRGKALYTRLAHTGVEFDTLNNTPMFRYNAYFGMHTVYYMDLVEHYGREALPMAAVVSASLKTMVAKRFAGDGEKKNALNAWTRGLFDKSGNPKFLAYLRQDGYPEIVPVLQAQTAGPGRLIFSLSAYPDELAVIPAGAAVAVFGMSLDMEDALVRGVYQGVSRPGGLACGVVEVSWVYNSMPPAPRQIYPEVELEPVSEKW